MDELRCDSLRIEGRRPEDLDIFMRVNSESLLLAYCLTVCCGVGKGKRDEGRLKVVGASTDLSHFVRCSSPLIYLVPMGLGTTLQDRRRRHGYGYFVPYLVAQVVNHVTDKH